MIMPKKKLGVITSVDGSVSEVGMYNMSNDAMFLWYGDILSGPKVGAYLTINQNDIQIIATVSNEKIIDQKNSIKSMEFDNRYSKNSINRIITLKTKGVIEDNNFNVTSKYVPMIGNEVTLTSLEELKIIFGIKNSEPTINIGKSLLEDQKIQLPINGLFASHIGIFGNTGSGKSNTLHKLYLELFRSKYYDKIKEKSQFYVIDFNGEYSNEVEDDVGIFGVHKADRRLFDIDTRKSSSESKLPVSSQYLFDADILAILFDARPATQVPFLRRAIDEFNNKRNEKNFNFGNYVVGTLKRILTSGQSVNQDSLQDWIDTAKKYINNKNLFSILDLTTQYNNGDFCFCDKEGNKRWFNKGSVEAINPAILEMSGIIKLSTALNSCFENFSNHPIDQLKIFLDFQRVHQTAWGKINREYLNPLFNRINSSFKSLEKIIEVNDNAIEFYKTLNIVSLVHSNQEITRLVPMLLSKMIYDNQKMNVSSGTVDMTKHLIIDEAHNILNAQFRNNGDDWQDYRLSIFEEIIKEGRKFGFYLTLASQRPADISPTIMSQLHNYFIHRLVNDNDLNMLENTMPTLDRSSYQKIPSLGKGETIVTGNAIPVPIFVKVDREEKLHPKSDDVILTDLWK